jgi:hypothetical protein
MERQPSFGALLGIAILLTLAACGTSDLLGPDAAQGVEGMVLLGPQCPVQTPDNPCPDLPYQAWIKVRRSGAGIITRIQSGEDGHFRVGLRPGTYILDPESGDPFPFAVEQEVEVEAGVYAEVVINFDTGIR